MIQINLTCGCRYEYRHIVTDPPVLGFHRIGFTPHGQGYERVLEVSVRLMLPLIPQEFYNYVMAHLETRVIVGIEEVETVVYER